MARLRPPQSRPRRWVVGGDPGTLPPCAARWSCSSRPVLRGVMLIVWPCGLMDKVLVFGTKDCRFESCQGHFAGHVASRSRLASFALMFFFRATATCQQEVQLEANAACHEVHLEWHFDAARRSYRRECPSASALATPPAARRSSGPAASNTTPRRGGRGVSWLPRLGNLALRRHLVVHARAQEWAVVCSCRVSAQAK